MSKLARRSMTPRVARSVRGLLVTGVMVALITAVEVSPARAQTTTTTSGLCTAAKTLIVGGQKAGAPMLSVPRSPLECTTQSVGEDRDPATGFTICRADLSVGGSCEPRYTMYASAVMGPVAAAVDVEGYLCTAVGSGTCQEVRPDASGSPGYVSTTCADGAEFAAQCKVIEGGLLYSLAAPAHGVFEFTGDCSWNQPPLRMTLFPKLLCGLTVEGTTP